MKIIKSLVMVLFVVFVVSTLGMISTGSGLFTGDPTQESRSWALISLLSSTTAMLCCFVFLAVDKYSKKGGQK